MPIPHFLENVPGSFPDAEKYMANWQWILAQAKGNFLSGPGFELWSAGTSISNPANGAALSDGWTLEKGGTGTATADFSRESVIIDTAGTYSMEASISVAGSSNSFLNVKQSVANFSRFAGLTVNFAVKVRTATANKVRVSVYDGVTTVYSSYHTGSGSFEKLSAAITCAQALTELTVKIEITSDFTDSVFIDSSFLYVIESTMTQDTRDALEYFGPDDPLSLLIGTLTVLQNATIAGTLAVTGALSAASAALSGDLDLNGNDLREVATLNDTFIGLGRNRIINADMRVDQRGVGAAFTVNSATAIYTLDRWGAVGAAADGVFTVIRSTSTPPTGFSHFLRATVTTADASIGSSQFYSVFQKIEGSNVLDFLLGSGSAKTVTLSFWVRSSLTGTFSGALQNSAQNRSYPFTYAISSANTWEQKTVTVVLDTTGTWLTTNGIGLSVYFDLGSGTTVRGTAGAWAGSTYYGASSATSVIATNAATWDLTGVQMEIGAQASAFEYKPMATIIQSCQRYYEKSYDLETALAATVSLGQSYGIRGDGADAFFTRFTTRKRGLATVVLYSPITGASGNVRDNAGGADSAASATAIGEAAFAAASGIGTAGRSFIYHWAASAEL